MWTFFKDLKTNEVVKMNATNEKFELVARCLMFFRHHFSILLGFDTSSITQLGVSLDRSWRDILRKFHFIAIKSTFNFSLTKPRRKDFNDLNFVSIELTSEKCITFWISGIDASSKSHLLLPNFRIYYIYCDYLSFN